VCIACHIADDDAPEMLSRVTRMQRWLLSFADALR
jgi:hypothetical protein